MAERDADPPRFTVARAGTAEDVDAVRVLMRLYAASLPIDLSYQGFEAELAGLPGRYAPPTGGLFLARDDGGRPVGCVALRSLAQAGRFELKRLFVLPAARGHRLGEALTDRVIAEAARLGCRELCLDTLASMDAAQRLYASRGFRPTGPYYAPTPAGTVFMALAFDDTGPENDRPGGALSR